MLMEKEAASLHVGAEEGGGCEGHRHHFGGGEAHLGIVAVSGGLQELLAQAVDGGYGIFQCVLLVPKVEWPSNREDIVCLDRGQLGLFITTFFANFRELRKGEVRRIPLPRTWVNRLQDGVSP
jgi:hypothetical protein